MSDLRNILNALLHYGTRHKYLGKSIEATVRARPAAFLAACRALSVDRFGVLYLSKYPFTVDVNGRSISTAILSGGSYQYSAMQQVARRVDCTRLLFVNVGANIGTTCLNAYDLGFRRFLAVEPVRRNHALLTRNLTDNALAAEIVQAAIGPHPGEMAINLNPNSGGRHSFKVSFDGGTEQVAMKRLDGLGIADPFFLWLDTEGFELEVLTSGADLLTDLCRGICVEVTPVITGAEAALKTLDLLEARFPRVLTAQGAPCDLTTLRDGIGAGRIAQTDLIALPA